MSAFAKALAAGAVAGTIPVGFYYGFGAVIAGLRGLL